MPSVERKRRERRGPASQARPGQRRPASRKLPDCLSLSLSLSLSLYLYLALAHCGQIIYGDAKLRVSLRLRRARAPIGATSTNRASLIISQPPFGPFGPFYHPLPPHPSRHPLARGKSRPHRRHRTALAPSSSYIVCVSFRLYLPFRIPSPSPGAPLSHAVLS
jgi:hypothetical protein